MKWQTIRMDRTQSYGSKVTANYDYHDRQTAGFVFLLFLCHSREVGNKRIDETVNLDMKNNNINREVIYSGITNKIEKGKLFERIGRKVLI